MCHKLLFCETRLGRSGKKLDKNLFIVQPDSTKLLEQNRLKIVLPGEIFFNKQVWGIKKLNYREQQDSATCPNIKILFRNYQNAIKNRLVGT